MRTIRAAEDQDVAETGGNGPNPEDDFANFEEDADRDKRQSFGHAGSAGGSGNFLFDIIRVSNDS